MSTLSKISSDMVVKRTGTYVELSEAENHISMQLFVCKITFFLFDKTIRYIRMHTIMYYILGI